MDGMGRRGGSASIIAATLSVALLGACSAGSGDDEGTAPSPTAPTANSGPTTQAPTPTPSSISVKEYTATLTKAVNPVAAALDELATAKRYKGLERRLTDVETTATKAASTLGRINPPPELTQPNAQLVAALRAFDGAAGRVSSKVDAKTLCTGSAARAGLGDAGGTSALRKAMASVSAKLPGDQPVLKLPSAGQQDDPRPSTGTFIRDVYRGARAELEIDNGGSADALVTLTKGDKPDISVYVRRGRTYTVKGVPDGTYTVYFSTGGHWDDTARAFGRSCAFSRFEDPLKFRTTRDARGIYWQNFRIGLEPFVGGNARTDDVDPNDFPDS